MKTWRVFLTGISLGLVMAAGVSAQPPGPEGQAPEGRQGDRGAPFPPPFGGPFDPMRSPLVTALDANRDGELSAEEIANTPQALKKLDKNGDGKLTRDELLPAPPGRGGPGGPGGRRGPGGMPPFGPAGGPGGMGPFGPGRAAPAESSLLPKDEAEKKILRAIQEIGEKQGRMANVPTLDGRMLRVLAESLGARTVVEIGTSNGISALWFSLALRKTGGKLITHEIDPQVAALARENFASAGVADLVTVVEGDAHKTVSKLTGPLDLVFIDADKAGYLDYFQKLLPLVRPGGLVLAHNMTRGMADPGFLKAITTAADVETVFYMEGGGLSVTLKKR
jgi:predicted O-methyltransferase YrrM